MVEKPNYPKSDDAVLGGQAPAPVFSAVLGGIGGVKHYLANGDADQRMAALPQALNYGKDGLELLICALTDKSWEVQRYAYSLLQENVELELKQALQIYNPYLLLECLHSFPCYYAYSLSPNAETIAYSLSPDAQTIACSRDGVIKLWDVDTAELKNTLIGHRSNVIFSLAYGPSTG